MKKINIVINGKNREIPENLTVKCIIDELIPKSQMFVVEYNLEILQKENFPSITLKEGDSLEIVSFCGGG